MKKKTGRPISDVRKAIIDKGIRLVVRAKVPVAAAAKHVNVPIGTLSSEVYRYRHRMGRFASIPGRRPANAQYA